MQRAGLLKWFLDIFRRLMPQTENHSLDRSCDVGRVPQIPRKNGGHPVARRLRRPKNQIGTGMTEDRPVLGVAYDQFSVDILPREVRVQIKLAGIARHSDALSRAEEFDLIAELHRVAPVREKLRVTLARLAVDLNGLCLKKERS